MPFGFHPLWIVILLAIVLIIFGPGKLPELGGAIGKGLREFRKASSDLTSEITKPAEEPVQASAPPPTASEPATTEATKAEPSKS